MKFRKLKSLLLIDTLIGGLTGCENNTNQSGGRDSNQSEERAVTHNTVVPTPVSSVEEDSTPYIKRKAEETIVENEPKTLSEHALVVSGNITVKKTLTTDGPLGDVISFGKLNAKPRSLDISGKISSSNDLGNAIIRSYNYKSDKENSTFSQIRALKVGEYLNTALLDEYYLLSKDGQALHRVRDQNDTNLTLDGVSFTFTDKKWTISGDKVEINLPIKIEGSLDINTTTLFVKDTLMVEGDLNATGELNINTSTPFSKALIVDNRIEVDKLVMIGRLHGSGNFLAHGEVNIMGNAEIDGDVMLYGDAKINFLDNIYKAALYDAQEEAEENNSTMSLVHSQLFSNAKGKNSVILFTFVEGNYIINENTLFELIEHNQTNKFKFKSYLYGATIDYGTQLQKFDTLSPYYENKLALINKFKDDLYDNVKISESIDIAPSALYHSFEDEDGEKLGTYLIYSFSTPFDINKPNLLTQEQRDSAIYLLEYKEEIEDEKKQQVAELNVELRQNIIDNNETNLSVKSELLLELDSEEANLSSIDQDKLKLETIEDRVHEWVEYKELADSLIEINTTKVSVAYAEHMILPDSNTSSLESNSVDNNNTVEKRGELRCCHSWRRRIRHAFRRVTFRDCKKKKQKRLIWGVNEKANDTWTKRIALGNDNDICTASSIGMIIDYHLIKKHKTPLYSSSATSRYKPWQNLPIIKKINSGYNHSHFWDYYTKVPKTIKKTIKKHGLRGYSYTRTIASGIGVSNVFSSIKNGILNIIILLC